MSAGGYVLLGLLIGVVLTLLFTDITDDPYDVEQHDDDDDSPHTGLRP